MRMGRPGWMLVIAALSFSNAAAAGGCKLLETPPIPVTLQGLRPTVVARINGLKARFIVDTGAFYSLLSPAAAAEYKLPLRNTVSDDSVWGMTNGGQDESSELSVQGFGGGQAAVQVATVKTFTYLGVPLRNIPFEVGGNALGGGVVGLLGDNLLHIADTEYDFRDGMMRLVRPVHCGEQPLIFWAKKGQPVAVVALRFFTAENSHIIGHGSVNGHRISILFDTGSPRSYLSLAAARRAGITPHSPGVVPAGKAWGIAGYGAVKTWIAPVADLKIGTENIEHTHLLIADFGESDLSVRQGRTDMVAGEDFFLSHRIFVAYDQRKLYFAYSGGPVFDLGLPSSDWRHARAAAQARPHASVKAAADAATASVTGSAAVAPEAAPAAPGNAAELTGRGLAYAAQHEFRHALADLGRACRLEPRNAKCLYRLGTVYWQDKQPAEALRDFSAAIHLNPNDLKARLARAQLQVARKDWPNPAAKAAAFTEVKADLDAVKRLLPPESDLRLTLSGLYDDIGQYTAAIGQIRVWTRYHEHDIEMAAAREELGLAWNNLCWRRARHDQDLGGALRDCDRALRYEPKAAAILDSTGLVNLRLGRLDGAIEDYDAALRRNARMPTSLYGRGLAELRKGERAKGQADLTAARKLDAGIVERFARMGLAP